MMNDADYFDLNQKAIRQALNGQWREAIKSNQEIIKINPKNIDALCRLAKAYFEAGETKLSYCAYKKILKMDRFNPIAKKYLSLFKKKEHVNTNNIKNNNKVDPKMFLSEPGKTKIVSLVKLGLSKVILNLSINEAVKIRAKKHFIAVYNTSNYYLGRLPDDLSLRLIKLINNGNQYKAVVQSFSEKKLLIFIKEKKQSRQNTGIPSFPISKDDYQFFIPQSIFNREPLEEINADL